MTTLTVDLPNNLYERLSVVAQQQQTTIEAVVEAWLVEKSAARDEELIRASIQPFAEMLSPRFLDELTEHERAIAALQAAGLLTTLSAEEKQRADTSTLTLEEARAILDRADGKPLSEVILEMRGPKE